MIIDEIFRVMDCFPNSYINRCEELILSDKGNVCFTAKDCKSKEDVICKLLERGVFDWQKDVCLQKQ